MLKEEGGNSTINTLTKYFFLLLMLDEKSRIRETKNLSTDADSRTGTILKRLRDLSKKKKIKKK